MRKIYNLSLGCRYHPHPSIMEKNMGKHKTKEQLEEELKKACIENNNTMLTIKQIDDDKNLASYNTYKKLGRTIKEISEYLNVKYKTNKTNSELYEELKNACIKNNNTMLTSKEINNDENLSSWNNYSNRLKRGIKELAKEFNVKYIVRRNSFDAIYLYNELKNACIINNNTMLLTREIDKDKTLRGSTTYKTRLGMTLKELAKEFGVEYIGDNYKISKWELEVREYIKSITKETIIHNDRKSIKPLELDIYIPNINIAIECNGVYWHSVNMKDKNYHITKTERCLENNIVLIHIWDYEWETNKESIKKYIYTIINGKDIKAIPNTKEGRIIIVDRMKPILYNNVEIYDYTEPEIIFIGDYDCWNCGNIVYKICQV